MSIGRRIYRILRAQVGHYARQAEEYLGKSPGPNEAFDDEFAHEGYEGSSHPDAGTDAFADAYRLLELRYGSDADAIRTAHRRLLRRFHPDRFARDEDYLVDATRLSQELTAARDLLLKGLKSNRIRTRTP